MPSTQIQGFLEVFSVSKVFPNVENCRNEPPVANDKTYEGKSTSIGTIFVIYFNNSREFTMK
jgi:hypothetical protein